MPDATLNPLHAYDVNTLGIVRLLRACARLQAETHRPIRTLVVGSAEQYGQPDRADRPFVEGDPLRPLTVYAATKAAAEMVALQAARADGLDVVCTRSFSHSGIGHGSRFLIPSLVARALALPASGGVLTIGNGDTVRDVLHVVDVVDAYLALLSQGTSGDVYNVSSGTGWKVREIAQLVLDLTGKQAAIISDPAFARKNDVAVQVGNSHKLREDTSWQPTRSMERIITDLIHG